MSITIKPAGGDRHIIVIPGIGQVIMDLGEGTLRPNSAFAARRLGVGVNPGKSGKAQERRADVWYAIWDSGLADNANAWVYPGRDLWVPLHWVGQDGNPCRLY